MLGPKPRKHPRARGSSGRRQARFPSLEAGRQVVEKGTEWVMDGESAEGFERGGSSRAQAPYDTLIGCHVLNRMFGWIGRSLSGVDGAGKGRVQLRSNSCTKAPTWGHFASRDLR